MRRNSRNNVNKLNYTLGIYGKLIKKKHCRAYCKLHKCYLGGYDIKERKCAKCKHKKDLKEKYYG